MARAVLARDLDWEVVEAQAEQELAVVGEPAARELQVAAVVRACGNPVCQVAVVARGQAPVALVAERGPAAVAAEPAVEPELGAAAREAGVVSEVVVVLEVSEAVVAALRPEAAKALRRENG
jgi:hypothetical protein